MRGDSSWLTTKEAAESLGYGSASAIRSCIHRGELVPDGRGPRNMAMFHTETLDAFLVDRASRYPQRRHAVLGPGSDPNEESKQGDALQRRPSDSGAHASEAESAGLAGQVPNPGGILRPEDGTTAGARPRRTGTQRGGGQRGEGGASPGARDRRSRRKGCTGSPRRFRDIVAAFETSRAKAIDS